MTGTDEYLDRVEDVLRKYAAAMNAISLAADQNFQAAEIFQIFLKLGTSPMQ